MAGMLCPSPSPFYQALLEGMGIKMEREEIVPNPFRACGGNDGEQENNASNLIGIVTEVAPNYQKFDADGYVWGRPGHYPLWVMLGHQRYKSQDGHEAAKVLEKKQAYFDQWKVWPWWIYHESEALYYLPGPASTGRGYPGAGVNKIRTYVYVCVALANKTSNE